MQFYVGETGVPITWIVTDQNGAVKNLSGATATAVFVFANQERLEVSCSLVTGGTTGRFQYTAGSVDVFSAARVGPFEVQATYVLGAVRMPLEPQRGFVLAKL